MTRTPIKVTVKFFDKEASAKTENAALSQLYKLYKNDPRHLNPPTRKQFDSALEYFGFEVIKY